jgi:phosphate transport system substrate-binding protein
MRPLLGTAAAAFALGTLAVAPAAAGEAVRDRVLVVGSSTVAPFAEFVIDRLARVTGHVALKENTGTGAGIRRFCAGAGLETPDVVAASRPMAPAEREACRRNGVERVVELAVGLDGIVVAGASGRPHPPLTRAALFSALAREVERGGRLVPNPHRTWREVAPSLPDAPIEVHGPPPTSGTRDAFLELAMLPACEASPAVRALPSAEARERACTGLREDGAYVATGEDDRATVELLRERPGAVGIFGYSFLVEAGGALAASPIEGVSPDEEAIAAGRYPLARRLLLYVKGEHADRVPGLRAFVDEFLGEAAAGPEGYLADAGLVPLPEGERARTREAAAAALSTPAAAAN